jgi:iron complex outermembrane recepter protein
MILMPFFRRFLAWHFCLLPALLILLAASDLPAQAKQLLTWRDDLAYLRNAPNTDLVAEQDAVEQIRTRLEVWLKLHPDLKVGLPSSPARPWSVEEALSQVDSLSETLATILREDTGRPFDLGVTTISVTEEASPTSPLADSFSRDAIVDRQAVNAAAALDYLPGVAINHISGGRNEAAMYVRGFSTKGQISFYIDGIPVSMPYDGTIDFNRFLAGDIAEVQVAKGFSSPLLGANAMGGSINLVTRQPQKKYQGDVLMGTGSGDMLLSSVNLGTRWQKFYFQGSFDWLQSNFFPLSGNFPLNAYQSNYKRNNADTSDAKYSGRFGWTPKGEDQYVFSYSNQKAEKGVPLYAGANPAYPSKSSDYRRWPYWDKTAYYLITNTGLDDSNSIKFRAYYDQFKNSMDFYDDATFSTMNSSSSNHSGYNESSAGASTEFTTREFQRHLLSASFSFRNDEHKEALEYPALSLVAPPVFDRAQTLSFGVQDIISISSRLRATVGFSADTIIGLQVQKLNSKNTGLEPFRCTAAPNNSADFSLCVPSGWNYNPQASLSYALTPMDALFVTFSDRGRFPLLKETYSYKLGTGIANPDLKSEHNIGWDFGYSHAFYARAVMQVEYFYNRLRDAIASIYVVDTQSLCSKNTSIYKGYCTENVNASKGTYQGAEFSVRSTPVPRLTLDVNYSYLNRTLAYDFANIDINQVLASALVLPAYPKNKVMFNATMRLPHEILAIASYRYEGGIALQDGSFSPKASPLNLPFATSYGTVDLGTLIRVYAGFSVQAGVRNLSDRDYYYTAGYPEPGRNWYFNLRYQF